jgi:prepilin-type N-terminal cleavage/methylation domain-containing protein
VNSRGLSLLEVVVALSLLGLVVYLAGRGAGTLGSGQETARATEASDFQLLSAVSLIQKVGRVSRICNKAILPTGASLRCQIDLSKTNSGVLSWVRFSLVGTLLQYQRDDQGDGTFSGPITVLSSFPNVGGFRICNDADMALPATCPLEPTEMNRVHTANLGGKPGRFYRFQVAGAQAPNQGRAFFQGAFFVRNPTTPWAPPNSFYSW